MVYYFSSEQGTYCRTESVCHEHKQSLCGSLYVLAAGGIYKQSARNVEEVKCHTVYETREYEQCYSRECRIAKTEEAESQDPCEHGDEHNVLYAVSLQEERNEQYAECFGNLGDRYQ